MEVHWRNTFLIVLVLREAQEGNKNVRTDRIKWIRIAERLKGSPVVIALFLVLPIPEYIQLPRVLFHAYDYVHETREVKGHYRGTLGIDKGQCYCHRWG